MTFSNNQKFIRNIIAVTLTAVLIVLSAAPATFAASKPGSDYVQITEKPVKVGKYYYKQKFDERTYVNRVVRSAKKLSGYKTVVKDCYNAVTNGKIIYYLDTKNTYDSDGEFLYGTARLNRCSVTGNNKTVFRSLPKGKYKENMWWIGVIKGNNILLTCSNITAWKLWTYKYNVKSRNLKKVRDNCSIEDVSGNYVIAQGCYQSEAGPNKYTVYKITPSGNLKKVKYLGWLNNPSFVGKKLYYGRHKNGHLTWYRCNRNGSGTEKLGSVELDDNAYNCGAYEYTSKYCKFTKPGGDYKFTYKTQAVKLIRKW